jgi:flagellar biosynthetic protein FliP
MTGGSNKLNKLECVNHGDNIGFSSLRGFACRPKFDNHMASVKIAVIILFVFITFFVLTPITCLAKSPTSLTPYLTIGIDKAKNPGEVAIVLQIFALLTILTLAPAILIMLTSFTRIAIVLSLLRQAMGTHQMPPNQIVIGLALFLTFFIMSPVWQTVNEQALQPYLKKEITQDQALKKAFEPIRSFMFKQTREKDLALLVDISNIERPKNIDEVPTSILIPSFIISELKTAFQIGFLLYIPFLVIDMVVASVLLSMGMMMLPPIMISLPFKLMLFVLADGWYLIVGSLIKGFG